MSNISRRQFLQAMVLGFSASAINHFLVGCGQVSDTPAPNQTDMTQLKKTTPDEKNAHLENPDLVIARGGEPEELVRRAIAAFGGMETVVPVGSDVIIKPNICHGYHTFEYATTTNPWVVAALVKLCYEAGASKVRVMDNPFGGSTEKAYEVSGIAEQVALAGGEMALMPNFMYTKTEIPRGKDIKQVEIFGDILKTDVLIDVPIAKHHSLAGLTLGMKNLLGVIKDRPAMHSNLGQRLADLTSLVTPTLTVVDAVRMLMDHGPTGGNLADVKKIDTVIVSNDIVAADSYAATLFGLQPEDLDYIRAAAEMGLGTSKLNLLKIEEISADA
jgi:uncharacterized protein (DUF362 family)